MEEVQEDGIQDTVDLLDALIVAVAILAGAGVAVCAVMQFLVEV